MVKGSSGNNWHIYAVSRSLQICISHDSIWQLVTAIYWYGSRLQTLLPYGSLINLVTGKLRLKNFLFHSDFSSKALLCALQKHVESHSQPWILLNPIDVRRDGSKNARIRWHRARFHWPRNDSGLNSINHEGTSWQSESHRSDKEKLIILMTWNSSKLTWITWKGK